MHKAQWLNTEPSIAFIDQLIQDAVNKNVSDIHIEPAREYCRIRFRRDGLLYEAASISLQLAARIKTRLKVMANLNIAERRLPQDGRIILHANAIDIRLSTCPTLFEEKIVLRILETNRLPLDMHTLGLTEKQKMLLLAKLQQPQGLILVTGPTGSGKTLTLYSALRYLNHIEKNIVSVEDPIEIELPGISQVNVNLQIGLDFATVLRTFLRQDPDIIMLGEIRDLDTATIAMQAAQTGHLVLSTLHSNHALETLTRLQAMGVKTHQIMHALSLIIAQRLVRKLCGQCDGSGCLNCHHGYAGRTGIFELIPMTDNISQALLANKPMHYMKELVRAEGVMFLREAAEEKVRDGVTDEAEVERVLG
ncbi:MAG TPA: GspE/PulE family protein [Gammaproteobacteria bacterium]|jgi:type IV pilus assembly protein PilB|nr:GspE/PulE family protein [Gammaproteobacteria bacterium]